MGQESLLPVVQPTKSVETLLCGPKLCRLPQHIRPQCFHGLPNNASLVEDEVGEIVVVSLRVQKGLRIAHRCAQ